MCYNCGCGIRDDDMGNPKSITSKTIHEAAKGVYQSEENAKRIMYELLRQEFEDE